MIWVYDGPPRGLTRGPGSLHKTQPSSGHLACLLQERVWGGGGQRDSRRLRAVLGWWLGWRVGGRRSVCREVGCMCVSVHRSLILWGHWPPAGHRGLSDECVAVVSTSGRQWQCSWENSLDCYPHTNVAGKRGAQWDWRWTLRWGPLWGALNLFWIGLLCPPDLKLRPARPEASVLSVGLCGWAQESDWPGSSPRLALPTKAPSRLYAPSPPQSKDTASTLALPKELNVHVKCLRQSANGRRTVIMGFYYQC